MKYLYFINKSNLLCQKRDIKTASITPKRKGGEGGGEGGEGNGKEGRDGKEGGDGKE